MHMHRLSASVHGCASRFADRSWIARCSWVNPVAVQRGLQENGRHYRAGHAVGEQRLDSIFTIDAIGPAYYVASANDFS